MPEEFLMELGFTKNESKVYFSLLKRGSITAGQISSDTSIHRTNVYDCLERLIEKGLVNYIHKEGKKFYQASDPEKIKDILVEKERKFREVLPNMLKLKKDMPQNDLAEIHRGMKAFRMILYSLLRKKKSNSCLWYSKSCLDIHGGFHLHVSQDKNKKKSCYETYL